MEEEFVPEPNFSFVKFMVAGSTAGVMEHLCMFPVDTIKTRMQTAPMDHPTVRRTVANMMKKEGVGAFYRGCTVIVAAAIPSHAVHFSTYETLKSRLSTPSSSSDSSSPTLSPVFIHALSGSAATCAHDAVVTPLDVIKQRLQMANSPYQNFAHCIREMSKGGWTPMMKTLYSSYPITVAMNIPFVATHFAAYEAAKSFFTLALEKKPSPSASSHPSSSSPSSDSVSPIVSLLSGALAGSTAGLISTPFDVVKTTLQTQQEIIVVQSLHNGGGSGRCVNTLKLSAVSVIKKIAKTEGIKGFWRGSSARVLYFLPSSAICFTTYEMMKKYLKEAW